MKIRKIIEIKCNNDLEAILKAQEALFEAIRKQPYYKHTVSIELSNGKIFQMYANPGFKQVYQA